MTIFLRAGSVSDDGLLLHADDAAAQACLAVLRLERALARRGGPRPRRLGVEVRAGYAAAVTDVVEIVRERLGRADTPLEISTVESLDPPGAIVGLWAEVDTTE